MSLETARNLSIPDLLDVVNEKLDLECVKLREIRLPPIAWATSMEREVSEPSSHGPADGDSCESFRSKASNTGHIVF